MATDTPVSDLFSAYLAARAALPVIGNDEHKYTAVIDRRYGPWVWSTAEACGWPEYRREGEPSRPCVVAMRHGEPGVDDAREIYRLDGLVVVTNWDHEDVPVAYLFNPALEVPAEPWSTHIREDSERREQEFLAENPTQECPGTPTAIGWPLVPPAGPTEASLLHAQKQLMELVNKPGDDDPVAARQIADAHAEIQRLQGVLADEIILASTTPDTVAVDDALALLAKYKQLRNGV